MVIQPVLLRKKPIKVYGTKTLMETYLLMITKMQIDRLNKILAHSPWESPAEFISAAFTENLSILSSSPPQNFNSLSNHEYDIIMSYGLSRIANLGHTDTIEHTGTVKDIDYFGKPYYSEESPDKMEPPEEQPDKAKSFRGHLDDMKTKNPESSIKFTKYTVPTKRLQLIEKNYKSIWDNPPLDIEDSLSEDDEVVFPPFPPEDDEAMFPPISQGGWINKPSTGLNIIAEHDDLTDKHDRGPRAITIEQSEKIMKKFLDDYKTEQDTLIKPKAETEFVIKMASDD